LPLPPLLPLPPPTEPPIPPAVDAPVPPPVDILAPPPAFIVPEVLPSDIDPSVLVLVPVLVPAFAPVPLDILFGPEPIVPWVAGALVDEVCAKAIPEQPIERAMAKPRSLRDMRIS